MVDEELFEQIIEGKIYKTWTEAYLRNAIVQPQATNKYYRDLDIKRWIVNYEKDDLKGEKWLQCPNYPQYQASNYGRIKYNSEICLLVETAECIYNEQPNKEILKKHPTMVGWLHVKGKGSDFMVHRLVADAWLEYPGEGYDIHHISNDGYDNSPYNLIYLPHAVHGAVHFGKEKYEPNFSWENKDK